jgi:hypothetical protein
MKRNFLFYFIPGFIFLYFILGCYPLVKKNQSEIFPFFSFKLYSTVDNHFERYDVLLDQGLPTQRFLLFRNSKLNKLERKYCKAFTHNLGVQVASNGSIKLNDCAVPLGNYESANVVLLSGNYTEAESDEKYQLEIKRRLK